MSNEVLDKIKSFLKENEFDMDVSVQCRHRVGLVGSFVAIKSPKRTIDGDQFIAVYPDYVVEWGVRTPYNYNDWSKISIAKPYSTTDELLEILQPMFAAPKAWT